MTHTLKSYLAAALTAMTTWACTNIPQPDLYADPDAITDVETARAFLSSVYAAYPHYDYELSLLGNDLCPTHLATKDVETHNLYLWQNKQISKLSDELWPNYYNAIAQTDAFMERLEQIKAADETQRTALEAMQGEALTIKAMAYFDLVRLYTPTSEDLKTAPGVVLKERFGLAYPQRITADSTYKLINQWLDKAEELLPAATDRNGWLTRTAARYLAAEVALQQADYAKAQALALPMWEAYHRPDNEPDILWADDTNRTRIFGWFLNNTFYNAIQYTAAEGDYYALNPQFNFDRDDTRHTYYYTMEMEGAPRQLAGKYNANNKQGHNNRYAVAMRYVRLLFIAAEAMARQGNESRAIALVNSYLEACKAKTIPTNLSGNEAIAAILTEKMKEYAGEGQNYFDLKRTGLSVDRLSKWGQGHTSTTIAPTDYRWALPIPASEYRYNTNIKQNTGWQTNGNN